MSKKKKATYRREVVIELTNNNLAQLHGPQPVLHELYTAFKVRHPNAFHLRRYMKPGWDGKMEYIKPNGKIAVGLVSRLINYCETNEVGKIEWEIADYRKGSDMVPKVRKSFKDWKTRDYQFQAVESVVNNTIGDIPFPRGAIKVATNGGKTTISTFIYLAYEQPTVFLVNSKELYEQALDEIPKITRSTVGRVDSRKIVYDKFMICMVATLKNRLKKDKKLREYMNTIKVLIVDEGDLANNKTNKEVIDSLYNANVRVALSGTIFQSKLAKDKIKNWNLESYFGPMLYEISNRTLIDKGVSSEVAVRIAKGNREYIGATYQDEYEHGIVKNPYRNKRILKRSLKHARKGRINQLIIAQHHAHIIRIYNTIKRAIERGKYPKGTTVDWVHHDRKERANIVADFKDGKLKILVGSMILKRGKNFPKMQYMINAGGGKSPENIIQLLGRAFRGCKHYEDMWDEGSYLKKHSRKRVIYYKNEKLKVTNPYR